MTETTVGPPVLIGDRRVDELILPVTFSPRDDRVRGAAVRLCEHWGVPLRLLFVSDSIDPHDPKLDALAAKLSRTHPELEVKASHVYGNDVATGICSAALPHSLIVMATDHADEWKSKSSTAERVVFSSGAPVLLFGPNATGVEFSEDVVIGLDGSASAEAALPAAMGLAQALQSQLWLVQVLPVSTGDEINVDVVNYIQDQASVIGGIHRTGWEIIHSNDPVAAIDTFASSRGASVIVAGARGRTDPRRQTMGSISMGLVAESARPVLTIAVQSVVSAA